MHDYKRGHLWVYSPKTWPIVAVNVATCGIFGRLLPAGKSSVLPSFSPDVLARPLCSYPNKENVVTCGHGKKGAINEKGKNTH